MRQFVHRWDAKGRNIETNPARLTDATNEPIRISLGPACSCRNQALTYLPERQCRVIDDGTLSASICCRVDLVVDERRLAQGRNCAGLIAAGIDARHELPEAEVLLLAQSGQDGFACGVARRVLCGSE